MLEKEIKILDINREELVNKLLALGANKTFEGYIHDVYYDFLDEGNLKMEGNKRLFRIRKKGEEHLYTIKRARKSTKEGGIKGLRIADEGENSITNIDSFEKVVLKYGMKKTREKIKHRTSYRLDNYEFDIDEYDGIPPLLEIEAGDKKEIKELIKKLSLGDNIKKTFGSRGLFKYYGKEYNYIN